MHRSGGCRPSRNVKARKRKCHFRICHGYVMERTGEEAVDIRAVAMDAGRLARVVASPPPGSGTSGGWRTGWIAQNRRTVAADLPSERDHGLTGMQERD